MNVYKLKTRIAFNLHCHNQHDKVNHECMFHKSSIKGIREVDGQLNNKYLANFFKKHINQKYSRTINIHSKVI